MLSLSAMLACAPGLDAGDKEEQSDQCLDHSLTLDTPRQVLQTCAGREVHEDDEKTFEDDEKTYEDDEKTYEGDENTWSKGL